MQAAVRHTETQVGANVNTIHIEQTFLEMSDAHKLRMGAFTKKSAQEGVTRLFPHVKRAKVPTEAAAQR